MKNFFHQTRWMMLLGVFIFLGLMPQGAYSQGLASNSQQIAAMKVLNPGLKTIGVIGSTLSDKDLSDITRYGLGMGVEMVFARPKDASEIATLYKKMVADKKIQMVWIPDANDKTMLDIGFEYLKDETLVDKIGLCVPKQELTQSGALCSVYKEEGKVVVYVNKRIAAVLGIALPQEQSPSITYVVR